MDRSQEKKAGTEGEIGRAVLSGKESSLQESAAANRSSKRRVDSSSSSGPWLKKEGLEQRAAQWGWRSSDGRSLGFRQACEETASSVSYSRHQGYVK